MRPGDVTAVVLCGGAGSRLGVTDKTLLPVLGRPLISYTVEALAPQVGELVLACGRDPAPYAALDYRVVTDATPGEGPLGGVAAALRQVGSAWTLVYPGDAPFPDPALVQRLGPTARAAGVAVPRTGSQRQNLVLLLARSRAAELVSFYETGGRAVREWLDDLGVEGVDMSDAAGSFLNVNTPADLATCEERLRS
jgi:molybdopterin-guanine dinucleotide biosynthesis protein A